MAKKTSQEKEEFKQRQRSGFTIINTVNKEDTVDPDKLTKPIFFFYGFCTCMIIVAITTAVIYLVGGPI